jgi:hypothetical protein
LGNILKQEPGSTVKHVNWIWPDCLVGGGGSGQQNPPKNPPDPDVVTLPEIDGGSEETARGSYNVRS